MNKAVTIIAVIAIIFLAGIMIFNGDTTSTDPQGGDAAAGAGTVYIAVTDAAADMENVSEVTMTTNNVSMHSTTNGWVEASGGSKTYDLLALNASGESKLYAKTSVAADIYNKVRMNIDTIEVTTTDGETHDAILPASDVTINGSVEVRENATSSVNLDVQADQSLHTAEDGTYVFAPVVTMQSRVGAQVSVAAGNTVTIDGGTAVTKVTAGVDLTGKSGNGAQVGLSETIELTEDGTIKAAVGADTAPNTADEDASAESETSANVSAESETTAGSDAGTTSANVEADVEGSAGVEY